MSFHTKKREKLKILFLSFYNLDYGIGASASLINQLNDLPQNILTVVIEPNRVDLPCVRIEVPKNVRRVKIPIPLRRGLLSFLYPFIAFFYGLRLASKLKPNIIFSMHHPFHALSFVGHIISKILHIPHVVDARDVWRPMGQKLTFRDYIGYLLEMRIAKVTKNDIWVFVNSENKKILEKRTNISFKNALILPNCISYSLLKNINFEETEKTRKGKEIRFIFVGRVGPEYGLHKIQPILDTLKMLGFEPKLFVVGHRQVKELPKYTIYIGSLPYKRTLQLIAESDVGVGPMNPTIATPRKVVEYLMLGKIVVAGKYAISRDIVKDFNNSIIELSENEDIIQVANKILTKLSKSKEIIFNHKKLEKFYCIKKIELIMRKVLQIKQLSNKHVT